MSIISENIQPSGITLEEACRVSLLASRNCHANKFSILSVISAGFIIVTAAFFIILIYRWIRKKPCKSLAITTFLLTAISLLTLLIIFYLENF